MNIKQAEELVLEALEHERAGVAVYTTALECAVNPQLKKEWGQYLQETREHVTALEAVCAALDLDAGRETSGREVLRVVGRALVAAMKTALSAGDQAAAQRVTCEAVVLAETKDHLNWTLLGKCAAQFPAAAATALKSAYDIIEDQEDEHLYHRKGWCRELWIESLGMPAVPPPPEERRDVKTAMGAARAEQEAELQRGFARTSPRTRRGAPPSGQREAFRHCAPWASRPSRCPSPPPRVVPPSRDAQHATEHRYRMSGLLRTDEANLVGA